MSYGQSQQRGKPALSTFLFLEKKKNSTGSFNRVGFY